MRHPDSAARLLRQQSTWRDPGHSRGSRDHDALGWEDAAAALAGAAPLATAAYLWCYTSDPASRRVLVAHLHQVLERTGRPPGVDPDVLVQLALDEQIAPPAQRIDRLRALVTGLSPREWRQTAQRPHARLLAELDMLAGDAWRVIRSRAEDAA